MKTWKMMVFWHIKYTDQNEHENDYKYTHRLTNSHMHINGTLCVLASVWIDRLGRALHHYRHNLKRFHLRLCRIVIVVRKMGITVYTNVYSGNKYIRKF